jgi:hypothetical protein
MKLTIIHMLSLLQFNLNQHHTTDSHTQSLMHMHTHTHTYTHMQTYIPSCLLCLLGCHSLCIITKI